MPIPKIKLPKPLTEMTSSEINTFAGVYAQDYMIAQGDRFKSIMNSRGSDFQLTSDAFRHAFGVGLLTMRSGPVYAELANLREPALAITSYIRQTLDDPWGMVEASQMDIWNNHHGRLAALFSETPEDLVRILGHLLENDFLALSETNTYDYQIEKFLEGHNLLTAIPLIENIRDKVITEKEEEARQQGNQNKASTPSAKCFGPDTPIAMWPRDPKIKPNSAGRYNEKKVKAKIWYKPIADIRVDDLVVSFDDQGHLVPGPVTRTFEGRTRCLLNFFGAQVTPGHAYLCGDGPHKGQFRPLFVIIRADGTIVDLDGVSRRAATNQVVGSEQDRFIKVKAVQVDAHGKYVKTLEEGHVRAGAIPIGHTPQSTETYLESLHRLGFVLLEDGEIFHAGSNYKGRLPIIHARVPRPEDQVLEASDLTLQEVLTAQILEQNQPLLTETARASQKKTHPTPNRKQRRKKHAKQRQRQGA